MDSTTLPGQTLTVRVKKSFPTANTLPQFKDAGVFLGSRYYTHADGPFELDAKVAERLIKEGLVDVYVETPLAKAQRAVDPKLGASNR